MRLLAVCASVASFLTLGCSSFVTVNDKTEGTVPRSFVVEGKLPAQSSDEMSEYLVRRFRDERATVRVIPYTGALVAKMEDEVGGVSGLAVPPKNRCVFVEVVTQDPEAAQMENLGLTLWLPGGKRVALSTMADSVQRNERRDWASNRISLPLTSDGRPLRAREAALYELESKELRCAEEAVAWEGGFAIEVRRLYDPGLPKQWLRWSVTRPPRVTTPAAVAATVEPLGVVKRSKIR